jgi:hypothetical protein
MTATTTPITGNGECRILDLDSGWVLRVIT